MVDFSSYENVIEETAEPVVDKRFTVVKTSRSRIPSGDISILTHSHRFHADEVLGCYILKKICEDMGRRVTIVRDRHKSITSDISFVVDMGNEYDPASGRYDHHHFRPTDALHGKASFGLLWEDFCIPYIKILMEETGVISRIDSKTNKPNLTGRISAHVAAAINATIVKEIDDIDINAASSTRTTSSLSRIVTAMNPNWFDSASSDISFMKCLDVVGEMFSNLCKQQIALTTIEEAINDGEVSPDGKVMIVGLKCVVGRPFINHPRTKDVELIISPIGDNGKYRITTLGSMRNDIGVGRLPRKWWGKQSNDMVSLTGVSGIYFCHAKGVILEVNGLESAMKLAGLALRSSN